MSEIRINELLQKLSMPPEARPLLQEALTHRTYAVERGLGYDNQRLEFLGDAVLEIIQTEYLFHLYPELPEGDLTKIRSALSCESMLAKLSRELKLGKYLFIGKGEKESGGNRRDSTLADLFEAVLGAVYLGAGFDAARKFVLELFEKYSPDPRQLLVSLNPKGRLQEFSQHKWHCTPAYHLLRQGGLQHQPFYEVEVYLERYRAPGRGNSRKNAEIEAAKRLCDYLDKRFPGE